MSHISSKPVRVCDRCYDKMSSGQVKPEDPVTKDEAQPKRINTGKMLILHLEVIPLHSWCSGVVVCPWNLAT